MSESLRELFGSPEPLRPLVMPVPPVPVEPPKPRVTLRDKLRAGLEVQKQIRAKRKYAHRSA